MSSFAKANASTHTHLYTGHAQF